MKEKQKLKKEKDVDKINETEKQKQSDRRLELPPIRPSQSANAKSSSDSKTHTTLPTIPAELPRQYVGENPSQTLTLSNLHFCGN